VVGVIDTKANNVSTEIPITVIVADENDNPPAFSQVK
jgi:hypothetical protein